MPPPNLTAALEVSLKKHRAINIDLSNIPDALKKVDKAIREPTVKTSVKVAQTLRPVMKLIPEIMNSFDTYDDICVDILDPTSLHDEEVADRNDMGKDHGGFTDGVRDDPRLDGPIDHEPAQAHGGAEEGDNSAKHDCADPIALDLISANITAEAVIPSAEADKDAQPPLDPNTRFKHDSLTASGTEAHAKAIIHLISLNEAYFFLSTKLLHKLKQFDKAMTETLTKPAASVRAELVRVRWDEVVDQWRAVFVRFWVGAGGDLRDLR